MENFLMVPVHLDALFLPADKMVVEAKADFSRLPYFNGERDINPDIAYISEDIVSHPFQNQNLLLKAGIHLHWTLPDALTKVKSKDGVFPAVPNRWLVNRWKGTVLEKSWMVESDYLYPAGEGANQGSIAYPLEDQDKRHPPFRYLGRKVSLDAWKKEQPTNNYLKDALTAVGYGEPSFAAFYPNCHSVFGFYEAVQDTTDLNYEVFGWYDRIETDHLNTFLKSKEVKDLLENIITDYKKENPEKTQAEIEAQKVKETKKIIEQEFKWGWIDEKVPGRICCYAHWKYEKSPEITETISVEISVGNTGTEALSAWLSAKMAVNDNERAKLEDQLEAFYLAPKLENRQLDIDSKFLEARHEKEFSPLPGGGLWTIRTETTTDSTELTDPDAAAQELFSDLNDLNLLQKQYNQQWQEIESMRGQLFSDWYKYMLCAYPPEGSRGDYPNIDEVAFFIEQSDIEPLNKKLKAAGELVLETGTDGKFNTDTSLNLANQIKISLNNLLSKIEDFNGKSKDCKYQLKPVPGPRYWRPTDPVLLLTGEQIKPSPGYGHVGLLGCRLSDSIEISQAKINPNEISKIISETNPDIQSGSHWHPLFLEWTVELFPNQNHGNHTAANKKYSKDFIHENYTLDENAVDLNIKPDKTGTVKVANVYHGSSILTPHAKLAQIQALERFLVGMLKPKVMAAFFEEKGVAIDEQNDTGLRANFFDFVIYIPGANFMFDYTNSSPDEQINQWLQENLKPLVKWYQNKYPKTDSPGGPIADKATSILDFAIDAYNKLKDVNCLSQSLTGFNEALLMHKQTLQLPVSDPLGFEEDQGFAQKVKKAAGASVIIAPQPFNDFNPIRNGRLRITALRIVDFFGQAKNLNYDKIYTPHKMTDAGDTRNAVLTPRLSQAARLNFRWLSAVDGKQEMNEHPATTPICGWLMTNHLDRSLMVYDNEGKALGSINKNAKWETAPGYEWKEPAQVVNDPENKINPHLKALVNKILGHGQDFLQIFLLAIDNALENISPENHAQHEAQALLMGRPIALVRAAINLELQGKPMIHQGWNEFRLDLDRRGRETDGFEKVEFPVRIGEYKQFNDGLVGFWKDGDESDTFYAPQSDIEDGGGVQEHPFIQCHKEGAANIAQSLEAPPQILSILMDPRGKIHATSGILPTKAIDIPPDQYREALQKIEITFLTAPILCDTGSINLSLPEETGYQWSWLAKEANNWKETPQDAAVKKAAFKDQLAALILRHLWSKEIRWLLPPVESPNDFQIPAERAAAKLGADFQPLQDTIEGLLKDKQSISKADLLETITEEAWNYLTDKTKAGWLFIQPNETGARLAPKNERNAPTFTGANAGLEKLFQTTLDLSAEAILPVNTCAVFAGGAEIHEGWLKLKKKEPAEA